MLAGGSVLGARPAGATVSAGDGLVASSACGSVVLSGSAWLGGDGVDVFSNGDDAGTGNSCGGISYVNGIVSGLEWQCVELVDRLYLTRGWIAKTWFGNGADMYATAPSNLAKQPQGSISFLSPGDVISYQSPGGVEPGHAGIVNTVTPISLGRYLVQLIQQNGFLSTSGILSDGTLTMTTPWVSGFPVIGVIHHPGATAPAGRPANLLANASFENDVTTGWTTLNSPGGTVQELARKASGLPEGDNLLELSTSRVNGSVYQDVPVSLQPEESYTFSVWARANAAARESICVVLWGLGSGAQHGQTCASVGSTWRLVSAPYDVSANGLTKLRAQVYLLTPGLRLDLIGASLLDDALANASFENDATSGWNFLAHGGTVQGAAEKASGLPEGGNVLALSTTRPNGSVYQDVPVNLAPGESYTFTIWARVNASKTENLCVDLWGIGSSAQHGQTCTSVGSAWKLVSAPYDVSETGLTKLRAQVYLLTTGLHVELTGASVTDDGLENAGYENDVATGWALLDAPGGTMQELAVQTPGLPEGDNLLELSTTRAGGSVYQDVPVNLETGQSYTFSIWARANASTAESICVVLWGLGSGIQKGQTCTKVRSAWTLVSAPYDVSANGLTRLRAQVYLVTPGLRLDLVGASLGGAR